MDTVYKYILCNYNYSVLEFRVCKYPLLHYPLRTSGPLEVNPGSDLLSGVDQQAAEGGGERVKGTAGSSGTRAEHAAVDGRQV